jgi:putative drug exporter of the RND superfamily
MVPVSQSPAGGAASFPSHRIGKWLVLAFWAIAFGLALSPARNLTGAESNESSSWLPANAESTKVLDDMGRFRSSEEIPAVVVYQRGSGLTPQDVQAVKTQTEKFAGLDRVQNKPIGPIPSQDRQALQVIVPIEPGSAGWTVVGTTVDRMRSIADGGPTGLQAHITGPGGYTADQASAFEGIDGKLLYSAGGVVVLILLLTYRSPVLWALPVVSAVVALFAGEGVIYLLAEHANLTVNAQSAGILTVLVFGAGTDYALLLVARYREELRRHEDRHEAMALALHRSGPAILASGSTVILGMLCLLLASMSSTQGLGPVAAIGVAVALLVMLTLLPALLVIFGRWVFWPIRPSYGSADHTETGVWARVGRRIVRRPRLTWVVTAVLLAVAATGLLQLDAHGLANKDAYYGKPDSVVGEQVLAKHFPAGAGEPVVVITNAAKAKEVRSAFAGTTGIDQVTPPTANGGLAILQGTLSAAPDSQAAKDTVDRVRTAVHRVPGANAEVGGDTAIVLDTLRASSRDNKVIIPVVLVVVLLILMLVLRSLVAPLILIATVVLSFASAMGLSALVFKHIFGFAGADASFPLYVFVFLVALGIDYNIFLMTRVHEEAKTLGTEQGALVGLAATGGVITSAGLVLAGTFAVLGTLPVVAFAEIGIAVALGVLLDTIVVRAVLVTALNIDVGRHMWWPSAMAKKPADLPGRHRAGVPVG